MNGGLQKGALYWIAGKTTKRQESEVKASEQPKVNKREEHFCAGCNRARYVGGTSVFVRERFEKECPRVKA